MNHAGGRRNQLVPGRRPLLVPAALAVLATGVALTGGTGIWVTAHAGATSAPRTVTVRSPSVTRVLASINSDQAAPDGMPWHSPNKITSGFPAHVASIARCPAPPNAGDSVLVQLFLSFGQSGGSGQVIPANSDGSWTGDVTFNFSGVSIRQTTISATCVDFTGVTGIPYAEYMTRHTQVFS